MKESLQSNKCQHLCLASASAQRHALLQQLGLNCRLLPMDIDESRLPGESGADYVHRLAVAKAQAAWAAEDSKLPVLGADTTVLINGQVLEKPADSAQASQMLQLLSGTTHQVYTGAGLVGSWGEKSVIVETTVTFKRLSAIEIERYIATGEPFGKAGAYAIQGRGAVFIEKIVGSYSNVMGLPLFETAALLAEAGIDVMLAGNE